MSAWRHTVSDWGSTPPTAQNVANGAVQHAERTLHLDRKVDVSRGVDQVDLVLFVLIVPECGGSGRGNGDTALLLLNHPVHRSAAFVYLTDLVGFTRVKKDPLRRGGLTGIDVCMIPILRV